MAFYPEIILIVCAVLILLFRKSYNKAIAVFVMSISIYLAISTNLENKSFWNVEFLRLVFASIILCAGIYAFWCKHIREIISLLIYGFSALHILDSNNLIEIFCCIELMMIASAYIIFQGKNSASKASGLRYLKMHIIAGTLILLGLIHHYETANSFYLVAISDEITAKTDLLNANFLLGAGFLINAAIFPFSAWLPDSYPRSSSSGSIILSVFTTKISIYLLAKIYFGVEALIILGVITIIYAFLYMLISTQLRRIIAYYIVMQNGILITLIGGGYVGNMNYLIALSSIYCFLAMFVVSYLKEKYNLGSFVQLNDKLYYKKAIIPLSLLGLFIIGLPCTISFPVKYYASQNQLYFSGALIEATIFFAGIAILGKCYSFYKNHQKFYFYISRIIIATFILLLFIGLYVNLSIAGVFISLIKKTIYLLVLLFVCGKLKNLLVQKEDRLFPDIDWIYRTVLYELYNFFFVKIIKPIGASITNICKKIVVTYISVIRAYDNSKYTKNVSSICWNFYAAAIIILLMILLL